MLERFRQLQFSLNFERIENIFILNVYRLIFRMDISNFAMRSLIKDVETTKAGQSNQLLTKEDDKATKRLEKKLAIEFVSDDEEALIKDVEITKQLEYNDDAMETKGLERNRKLDILDAKKESAIEYVSSNDDEDTLKSSIPLEKDENSASLDLNYHEFQSSQDPDYSILYPELYHDTLMTFCVDESKDQ